MRRLFLAFLILAAGCAESAQQAPPDKAPPGAAPATATATATPAPAPAPGAKTCAGQVCKPPEECITYSGMMQGVTSSGCYILCAGGKACPHGMTCTMINDGPGEVCEPSR